MLILKVNMFRANIRNKSPVKSVILTLIPRETRFDFGICKKYSLHIKPKSQAVKKEASFFNRVGIAGGFMFVIPVITFCLGTWQIQRRRWKLDLIKALEEKTSASPIELPYDLDEIWDLEYRKIRVKGKFDHSKELYIHPRSLLRRGEETGGGLISSSSQTGALVVTPFHLSDRDLTILVNRGWVPRKKMDPKTRLEGQIEEEIELVGVVRHNEAKSPFVPAARENDRFLHSRDIHAMAAMADAAPVFLDADSASSVSGGPIGGQTRVSLRNEHLSYILTWYSLCAATSFLWYKKFIQRASLM